MNYINSLFNLFNYNNSTTLLDETQHINDNTCIQIDEFTTGKKKRAYIPDFINFKYEEKNYNFRIGLNIDFLEKINADFYRNIDNKNSFYIKSLKPFYFSQNNSKLYICIYNGKKNTFSNVCFHYNINNHLNFNNDCICFDKILYKIYLFITRNNKNDNFYIEKIIYYE
tara:strand:- start:1589 stop:2095 length:507 start_codon:yes stop_codon:yes gene_type:complete